MKLVWGVLKATGFFVGVSLLLAGGYLCAAVIGAYVKRPGIVAISDGKESVSDSSGQSGANDTVTVFVLSSLLHTDIALPVDHRLLEKFPDLRQTRIPFDNPRLKFVGFGWGSKAFYTTAGSYSDIKFSSAWKAATGDVAVMRVTGLPALEKRDNVTPIKLPGNVYKTLLSAIHATFEKSPAGALIYRSEFTIGPADAFFEAKGDFNLFNPCNQWTADMFHKAGFSLGRWTPTSYALLWSLQWNGVFE